MIRPRILLIEDEPGLRVTLSDMLRNNGYTVKTTDDGVKGQSLALTGRFDLIILDIILPSRDGLKVCRYLRKSNVTTPILMITARGELDDKLMGFKAGGDDYLVKPFDLRELQFRVASLLRRGAAEPRETLTTYEFAGTHVDFVKRVVTRDGNTMKLNDHECRLLEYLISHKDAVLSRDELLEEVWGYNPALLTRTVDVHILWLRQKIEPDPQNPEFIVTVYGQGYRFAEPGGVGV